MRSENPTRRYGLDALRGAGALLVMLLHFHCATMALPLLQRGYLAVDLFFLLSGFVLGQAYDDRLARRTIMVRAYLWHRLARLYPIIFVGVVLGFLQALTWEPAPTSLGRMLELQLALLPALLAAFPAYPLNPPQWSLFFELAANAAHAVLAPARSALLAALVAVAALTYAWVILDQGSADVGAQTANFLWGTPRVVFGFFGGVLLYRWTAHRGGTLPAWMALLALALTVGAVILPQWWQLPRAVTDLITVMVLFPAVIWLGSRVALPPAAAAAAALAGELSYPLYAIHVPLLQFTATLCVWGQLNPVQNRSVWMLAFVVILAAAWGIAVADRSARQWLKRMKQRGLVAPGGAPALSA